MINFPSSSRPRQTEIVAWTLPLPISSFTKVKNVDCQLTGSSQWSNRLGIEEDLWIFLQGLAMGSFQIRADLLEYAHDLGLRYSVFQHDERRQQCERS